MARDVKEKKCGCVIFEVGPPVLCETHQRKAAKQHARAQALEEKGLRKLVADQARDHGHDLSRFKEYASAGGKWTAYCHNCGAIAIVYDRVPERGDQVNVQRLHGPCHKSDLVSVLGDADRDALAERFQTLGAERGRSDELPVHHDADRG